MTLFYLVIETVFIIRYLYILENVVSHASCLMYFPVNEFVRFEHVGNVLTISGSHTNKTTSKVP